MLRPMVCPCLQEKKLRILLCKMISKNLVILQNYFCQNIYSGLFVIILTAMAIAETAHQRGQSLEDISEMFLVIVFVNPCSRGSGWNL